MLGASLTPLFVGGLGPPELVVILLLFALLFGANRIPKLAKSTGQAMGEFQKGKMEAESGLDRLRSEVAEADSNADETVAEGTDDGVETADADAAVDS